MAAEVVYKKAQMIDPDANKACNLALCLKLGRHDEARSVLQDVLRGRLPSSDDLKSRKRAEELLHEVRSRTRAPVEFSDLFGHGVDEDQVKVIQRLLNEWAPPPRSFWLPIFEEISSFQDQLTC